MRKTIYTAEHEALRQVLQGIRLRAAMRQEDLAAKLGKPQSFVSKYESGERRLDFLEVREICGALGVPVEEFVRDFEAALRKA